MRIVGTDHTDPGHVHTIDMWFSKRRGGWLVERLDADGHHIGAAYFCADEQDAATCVEHWLRDHSETHLVAPNDRMRVTKALRHRHAA